VSKESDSPRRHHVPGLGALDGDLGNSRDVLVGRDGVAGEGGGCVSRGRRLTMTQASARRTATLATVGMSSLVGIASVWRRDGVAGKGGGWVSRGGRLTMTQASAHRTATLQRMGMSSSVWRRDGVAGEGGGWVW
jgi:hypothetical protein